MSLRLAVVVSHPIQYFAPLHRELARVEDIDLRVFFCCDWGLESYVDPGFGVAVKWDTPLLEGYDHEFLPIARRPERLGFWEVDNPAVGEALDRFDPDVVQVFGYAHRTNWRVVRWARRRRKRVLYVSDSNARAESGWLRRAMKQAVVRHFYSYVDAALFVSRDNRAYHRRYGVADDRLFRWVLPIDRERLVASVPDRDEARRRIRETYRIPADAFVAILSAKYAAHKRPLDLVAAAWDAARGGANVWSLLVGEGPERAAIEEYCRREGVTNATMTGFVNQSEIGAYYAAADVLVLPSSYEPYGLAVSEGASFGLPALVSDQVGCIGEEDVARPGINAIVFECGDRGQLRAGLERLVSDRDRYLRMSDASIAISKEQDVHVAARALASVAATVRTPS
jgi:glycosyltransferase involved in cell wall biosynthesis